MTFLGSADKTEKSLDMTDTAWPKWTTEIMKKTVRGEDQLGLESTV
jgi:hypothetical protein